MGRRSPRAASLQRCAGKHLALMRPFPAVRPSPLQLVRRNEELRLLYEKIKIQQSTLKRGQAQYRDRLNEIRVLKIKVPHVPHPSACQHLHAAP